MVFSKGSFCIRLPCSISVCLERVFWRERLEKHTLQSHSSKAISLQCRGFVHRPDLLNE